nr:phosphosugar-binding transcriptional regulator [Raoultella sp. NCTC 9187]
MFSHAAIASLNNLEMMVYHYVIKNRDKVMYMTIRELSEAAGVSTTTVLRFCRKLQCEGYSEFRVRFKLYLEQNQPQQANIGASEIMSFFKSVNNDEFDDLLERAVDIILASERIIFVGAGTSGALAKYGARFFSNVGKFSNHIDDPYFPVTNDMARNALAIVLSVSGETEEILRFAGQFQPPSLQSDVDNQPRTPRGWRSWLISTSPGTYRKRASAASTILRRKSRSFIFLKASGVN